MAVNTDDVIAAYVKFRDDKEALEKKHKDELAPFNDKLRKIEMWLQNQLQLQGLSNVKSENGTAFLQEVASVGVPDWESFLRHVIEHQQWELLEHRVSKTVIQDYLETNGELPPGVSLKRETVVRVRRG